MFIGHFALSFAAKRVAPAVSLGTLFLAAQLADLLWPNFVILGLESFAILPGATAVTPLDFVSYPYSHSLLALTAWAVIFGVAYWAFRRNVVAAVCVAVLVLSHWVLDVITHRADMPLAFDDTRIGLGLWQSTAGTLAVEGAMFAAGVAIYASTTRPRDRIGSIALWSLAAFLLVIYIGNVFGPVPPSVMAVAWSAQAMWLLVLWAFWVDRHRSPRRTRATEPR